jgi:hypothetical protein
MKLLIDNLYQISNRDRHSGRYLKAVKEKDYDKFCNEYIFDAIQGVPFGVAFCKKFDIIDMLLMHPYKEMNKAKEYIKQSGYINDSRSNRKLY